ncbi:winged helix-turn-helix domain-containing protein [Miltoncostaea oceani]|uniref:winged helix-turn-helix domain-containing protein n=1 Tax=Miltoncostaea oceani TaxID=2843216 RepID=UPI001C3E28BB|nr:crosslink repair DNA glycosylase YcaQ family protein [Miltoncostaea oceani]
MPPPRTEISAAQARRIALRAQGFGPPRPPGRIDRRHARRVLDRVGLIQIDSVNVLVRSQELPLFARLGPHPRDLLPRMAADGELFEFWCHEASLLPVAMWPLMGWRMARAEELMWAGTAAVAREDPGYVAAVLDEVRARGPITAGELSDPGDPVPGMWGRSPGKRALEHLFWRGEVSARRRPSDFARVYDLTERIIPEHIRALPVPGEEEAVRQLLLSAARSLGVATARDLCDYHRLNVPRTRPRVAELAEDGRLWPVTVRGWDAPAFLHPDAELPRRVRARALLSPFDSLVWDRARTERIFGFRYRIGIYTPAHRREHGYYVLPFLLGDDLVARVDLKADRAAGTLRVPEAHAEPGHATADVADALAAELVDMARWLGLRGIDVAGRGDLAPALSAAVATRASSLDG